MSNVKKRMFDPSVWEEPFFSELTPKQRLFWLYLNGRCELIGVHRLHLPADSAYLGFTIDHEFVNSFLEDINSDRKRVELLGDRQLWLIGFIRRQQTSSKRKCLSADCYPHKKIVEDLQGRGLFQRAVEMDPALYQEFTGEVIEDTESLPEDSDPDSVGYPLGYRVGYGKGTGYPHSNSPSNGRDSLYSQLLAYIPEVELADIGQLPFEKSVDEMKDGLEGKVDNPSECILETADYYDWENGSWEDFQEVLKVETINQKRAV